MITRKSLTVGALATMLAALGCGPEPTGAGGAGGAGDGLQPVCTEQGGLDCTCGVSGSEASGTCSVASIGGLGHCCADADYPAGGTCQCIVWACTDVGEFCSCGVGAQGTATACTTSFNLCCMSDSSCYCDDHHDTCPAGEQQVSNCEVALAPCGAGLSSTERCTP